MKAQSDAHRTNKTMTGHQEVEVKLFWGSKGRSLKAGVVNLDWSKGAEFPTLTVDAGKGVKLVVLNMED